MDRDRRTAEAVEVADLVVAYGRVRAVDGVEFSVRDGEFLTLLGPSGSGKTTILRCTAGLERPVGGEITIAGRLASAPVRGIFVPPEQRQIGMVFQSYAIWPHMTVRENVAFPLESRRMPRTEVRNRVAEVLELLELTPFADRPATHLSGGQQQRVALGRALAPRPRLLLLDEPLSNLDAKLRERTRYELKRLQRQIGITTIYVTHDQQEAIELSDRVVVLNRGRIEQTGSPKEIYDRPASQFVADFIGQANFIEGRLEASAGPALWRLRARRGADLVVRHGDGVSGQEVTVMVRPHRLALRISGEGSPLPNTLTGRVVRARYLGDRLECSVDVDGVGEVRALVVPDIPLAAGDQVCIVFNPEDGVILPARPETP